jgi:hypothetical protein
MQAAPAGDAITAGACRPTVARKDNNPIMNDHQSARVAAADIFAALDLPPGTAGIPRLLDELIWQVRARAATQIITEEQQHPADNWLSAAIKWDHVAVLAAELRDRVEMQARQ